MEGLLSRCPIAETSPCHAPWWYRKRLLKDGLQQTGGTCNLGKISEQKGRQTRQGEASWKIEVRPGLVGSGDG